VKKGGKKEEREDREHARPLYGVKGFPREEGIEFDSQGKKGELYSPRQR